MLGCSRQRPITLHAAHVNRAGDNTLCCGYCKVCSNQDSCKSRPTNHTTIQRTESAKLKCSTCLSSDNWDVVHQPRLTCRLHVTQTEPDGHKCVHHMQQWQPGRRLASSLSEHCLPLQLTVPLSVLSTLSSSPVGTALALLLCGGPLLCRCFDCRECSLSCCNLFLLLLLSVLL